MFEMCNHRNCSITKLLLLIKMASTHGVEGMSEDDILKIGLQALHVIGVSAEEAASSTIDLLLAQAGLD